MLEVSLALALLPAAALSAQEPQLLLDIDSQSNVGPFDSDPELLTGLFGSLWLSANADAWRFDPLTSTATQLSDDFRVASPAAPLGNGRVILRQEASFTNPPGRLLVSDGTPAGTEVLIDFDTYAVKSAPFAWAGTIAFFVGEPALPAELWTTDGTPAGTQMRLQLPFGAPNFSDVRFAVNGATLYVADATATGLAALTSPTGPLQELNLGSDFLSTNLEGAHGLGAQLLFTASSAASGSELWSSDGTPAGTAPLRDIAAGPGGSFPVILAGDSTRAWFRAVDSATGLELWTTDGTTAGTQIVTDLNPGVASGFAASNSFGAEAALLPGGDLLFAGSVTSGPFGGAENVELFRSDGTAAGTVLVADLNPSGESSPRNFVEAGGLVYFLGADGSLTPDKVFRTDGTGAGTQLLFSPPIYAPTRLYGALDQLWISAELPDIGVELLGSDGTPGGTQVAFEFAPEPTASGVDFEFEAIQLGQELLFPASSPGFGQELWATDGTTAGTRQISDLLPGAAGSAPRLLMQLGAQALFTTEAPGRRLWSTDGTAAGSVALTDPQQAFAPREFARLGELALFIAGNNPQQLWRTDGTTAGTAFVTEVQTNLAGAFDGLEDSVAVGGYLYFHGRDATGLASVWRTDGTAAGTGSFAQIPINSSNANLPRSFARIGETIYFTAASITPLATALWSLDVPTATAVPVFDLDGNAKFRFVNLGERLVFFTQSLSVFGSEPWVTDGTAAGTQILANIQLAGNSSPQDLTRIGDHLYFSALTGTPSARELWRTDGTPAGTQPLGNAANVTLPTFGLLRDFGSSELLLHIADLPSSGEELWLQDPVSGSQILLADVNPSFADAGVTAVFELNGRLVFDVDSPTFGRELFTLDLADLGTGSAEPFGLPCGLQFPSIRAGLFGDVAPGGAPELTLEAAPAAAIAIAFRSAPAAPLGLGGGCTTELDLLGARLLFAGTTSATGDLRTTLALPADPSLSGVAQTLQFVVAEPNGPLLGTLALSNAVGVVLR